MHVSWFPVDAVTFVNGGDLEAPLPSNVTFPPTPEESPPVPVAPTTAILSDNGVVSDNATGSDMTPTENNNYAASSDESSPQPPVLEAQTLFPPTAGSAPDAGSAQTGTYCDQPIIMFQGLTGLMVLREIYISRRN